MIAEKGVDMVLAARRPGKGWQGRREHRAPSLMQGKAMHQSEKRHPVQFALS